MTPEEARVRAIDLQGYGHNVPKPVTKEWLEAAEAQGMIRKAALVDGGTYIGCCRNAYVARWNAKTGVFWHLRYKFGNHFAEKINHPEDDDGFDVFVPTLLILGAP